MITLVCTKCGTTLNVDDGFAGGVCRCSSCGTIQTVPKLGEKSRGGEAIFERRSRNSGRELEAFGDIVTSSGLAGSGMLHQSRRGARQVTAANHRTKLAVVLGAAVAILAGGLWLALNLNHGEAKSSETSPPIAGPSIAPKSAADATANASASSTETPTAAQSAVAAAPPRPTRPSFGPIALDATSTVVYLVDRGDATRPFAAALQRAVVRSASSLGATRKFQVRYWSADGDSPAYPTPPAEATPTNVGRVAGWITDNAGTRSTDAADSLDAAIAIEPGEIVFLTGKAWQLDDAFADESIAKLAKTKVRVHCIALGGAQGSEAFSRIATKTGGTFVEMDEPTLAALAK